MAAFQPDDDDFLNQVYHHIVLPRAVPGAENGNLERIEAVLWDRLVDAIKTTTAFALPADQHLLDNVRLSHMTSKAIHVQGRVDQKLLTTKLESLEHEQTLLLHLAQQNAAVLIYRQTGDSEQQKVVFELLETSATCDAVLASENALQWRFPGHAVSVPSELLAESSFVANLATFLEQCSIEFVSRFAAITYKAAAPIPEVRDTADPALITGLLSSILEANGARHEVPFLSKRVRDTVSFKIAHKPWRRSPLYLAVRVAIQRQLYRTFGDEVGRIYYKTVLCVFIARFLDDARFIIPHEASHLLRSKLGRRLAKLEMDVEKMNDAAKDTHRPLIGSLEVTLSRVLSETAQYLESQWETFKYSTHRIVKRVDAYATKSDCYLPLSGSGTVLDRILHTKQHGPQSDMRSPDAMLGQYETSSARSRPFVKASHRYLALDSFTEDNVQMILDSNVDMDASQRCIKLASAIQAYISSSGDAFDEYPDLKSAMLLKLMELWVAMDQSATQCYNLLLHYHPIFEAKMMDTLHMMELKDMERVRSVQDYIAARCHGWGGSSSKTIFDKPRDDTFTSRYYDAQDDSHPLKQLRRTIDDHTEQARVAKKAECERLSQRWKERMQEAAPLHCTETHYVDDRGRLVEQHEDCHRCRLIGDARRMRIEVFEYPLPRFEPDVRDTYNVDGSG
ncbi:hypothetical protein BDV96DRAFT_190990 [Lophiotrema nucula]|uniref:DUF6606 domain-containing protein n=1 Tax=Lophiotrema nucula TaxID=690887 RepID=A0A6A5YUL2_9PLEO|nr:hypothetical protein BDV96DRAFT_190990 [Lophiotrema nucula]